MNLNGAAGSISVQEYWLGVRRIQAGLPEVVALVSTPDDRTSESGLAGIFVTVDSLTAAKCLFARTHRIATSEEIANQVVKRASDIREMVRARLAAQGIVAIQLPEQTSNSSK
jgi:hypothetical protein